MSFDCSNESQNVKIQGSPPDQASFTTLSTTSQTHFNLESSGNNGVLNTSNPNLKNSRDNLSSNTKRKPTSNHELLKNYQDFHLSSESTAKKYSARALPRQNDGNLETGTSTSASRESKRKQSDSRVCRFYHKYAYCHFGPNCRFVHEGRTDRPRKSNDNKAEDFDTSHLNLPIHLPEDNATEVENYGPRNSRRICRYFEQNGNCYYGESCNYEHIFKAPSQKKVQGKTALKRRNEHQKTPKSHVSSAGILKSDPLVDIQIEENDVSSQSNLGDKLQTDNTALPPPKSKQMLARKRPCWYFKHNGTCKFGTSCRYQHGTPHIRNDETSSDTNEKNGPEIEGSVNDKSIGEVITLDNVPFAIESPKLTNTPSKKPITGLQVHHLKQLTNEDLKSLRQTEITQLKKRFPKYQVLQDDNSGSEFLVEFVPSDPDWPFEVKLLELKVLFIPEYPVKPCFIEVVDTKDCFPETLIRSLDQNMQSWIKCRHEENTIAEKVETVFKPFLRWLDRNLEDLFIIGLRKVKKEQEAKAAGIEFVPFETLRFAPGQDERTPENERDISTNVSASQETPTPSTKLNAPEETGILSTTVKRGTEIVLRNVELGENTATLACRKISLTIQCGRCKNRNDIETPDNRANKIFCTRCHHVQTLTFRPQLIHSFGCVLGYLDLTGCQIVDMPIVNCNFDICCMNCSKTMSVNGLHYGQRNDNWCTHCNSKMTIFIDSVKFQYLQPTNYQGEKLHSMKLEFKEKRVKDPAIQEGRPLPNNGTCKHFKKSYRWLRFPCCGKAFPCDICHNETETDHEMKFATRMICGFCAKEQLFSNEKDCVVCSSSMTKKNSAHWEGGKGCRDKIKMSRDDQQKYAGVNKTVSRKTQDKKKTTSKK